MILTKENCTVEEYNDINSRKLKKFWKIVIISGTHKLHNEKFIHVYAAVAHRNAILGQPVDAKIEEDGEYYRVKCNNNLTFHSEKLNLASAIKLLDDLK